MEMEMEMVMLSALEWDAILIGAVLAYLVAVLWFSDRVFGRAYKQEIGSAVQSVNTRLAMLFEVASAFFSGDVGGSNAKCCWWCHACGC